MLAIKTVCEPGDHGAGITGTQGIGVNAPNAAVVAAWTAGLDNDEHMPKGRMFTNGLLSMMFASGVPVVVRFTGNTCSTLGAAPKLHFKTAPMQTCSATLTSISTQEAQTDVPLCGPN